MSDEKLIQLVQNTEILYNLQLKEYSDSEKKEKAWMEIGAQMQMTGSECKSRWTSLRDQYRRAIRRNVTKSGQANSFYKKWKYEEQMEFVRPYFTDRKTVSNIPQFENSQIFEVECSDEENNENIQIPNKKVKKAKTAATPSFILMKYLIDKKQNEQEEDADDLFFKSVAKSVKKLNPFLKNRAKKQILNIVSDLEEQQLIKKSNEAYEPAVEYLDASGDEFMLN